LTYTLKEFAELHAINYHVLRYHAVLGHVPASPTNTGRRTRSWAIKESDAPAILEYFGLNKKQATPKICKP